MNQTCKLRYCRFPASLYFISEISRVKIFYTKETGYFSVCLSLSSLFDKKNVPVSFFLNKNLSGINERKKLKRKKNMLGCGLVVDEPVERAHQAPGGGRQPSH